MARDLKGKCSKILAFLRKNKQASVGELVVLTAQTRRKVHSDIINLRGRTNRDYEIISHRDSLGEVVYECYLHSEESQEQKRARLLKSIFSDSMTGVTN
jgi:hypothetical protein